MLFFFILWCDSIPENLRLPRQSLHKDQDLNFNLCGVKHCILLECIKGEKEGESFVEESI